MQVKVRVMVKLIRETTTETGEVARVIDSVQAKLIGVNDEEIGALSLNRHGGSFHLNNPDAVDIESLLAKFPEFINAQIEVV